jgi:hypothetical protein
MAACGSPGSGKAQKPMYQFAGPTCQIREFIQEPEGTVALIG